MATIMIPVNYLAVFAAGVVGMVVGFSWYGPLFGERWVKLMGWSAKEVKKGKEKMGPSEMLKQMVIGTLTSLLMAYVLAMILILTSAVTGVVGIYAGLMVAFWSWLGFVVPVTLSTVLWEGRKVELWMLNAGYYLATLLAMGVVLSLWR